MENNPNFPDPPAALAEIKKLLPEYHGSVWMAKGRDSEAISVKNDKKATLIAWLSEVAAYATQKCNGDKTKLLSSGFAISGERGEQPLGDISRIELQLGKPGEVTSRTKRVKGAKAYMHQF